MVVYKLNLFIVASIAGGALWIEHGNHVNMETSAPAEVAEHAAAVCPDNESTPHSLDCFEFQGDVTSNIRGRMNTAESTPTTSPDTPGRADLSGPACPANNENVPYSANCLRFLSGWRWQATPTEGAP